MLNNDLDEEVVPEPVKEIDRCAVLEHRLHRCHRLTQIFIEKRLEDSRFLVVSVQICEICVQAQRSDRVVESYTYKGMVK